MDPRDKWRLRNNRLALLDVDAQVACIHLVEKGILIPDDSQRINSQTTTKDKTESLLNMLETKGKKAYPVFKDTLSKLKQDYLVQKLDETDMSKMPAKLRKELNEEAGDSPDKGNVIITSSVSDNKRQVSIEDEGFATHSSEAKKQKTSNRRTVITVKGNDNVVCNSSKVTYNTYTK